MTNIFDTGCSNKGIHLVTSNLTNPLASLVTHSHYENNGDGCLCSFEAIGTTLSDEESFTSNKSRRRGILFIHTYIHTYVHTYRTCVFITIISFLLKNLRKNLSPSSTSFCT